MDIITNVAKTQLNNNLSNQSAKADGNKKKEKFALLPFTLVNGFCESYCSSGFNPIFKYLSISTKYLVQ